MEISTIGFTKHTAKNFFGILKEAGITRLIDVRLNNVSQLAGFAKRDDLKFFLKELCGAEYTHAPDLAPTKELLDAYRKDGLPWEEYETEFFGLMAEREVESQLDTTLFKDKPVLLCSEHTHEHCHRRLVAEHLRDHWGNIEILHL